MGIGALHLGQHPHTLFTHHLAGSLESESRGQNPTLQGKRVGPGLGCIPPTDDKSVHRVCAIWLGKTTRDTFQCGKLPSCAWGQCLVKNQFGNANVAQR